MLLISPLSSSIMGMSALPSAQFNPLRPFCQYGADAAPGYGVYGGSHLMSPLTGGLVLVLLLAFVFILLTRITGRAARGREDSALDILKKRYARGELSREDFERMKRDLND